MGTSPMGGQFAGVFGWGSPCTCRSQRLWPQTGLASGGAELRCSACTGGTQGSGAFTALLSPRSWLEGTPVSPQATGRKSPSNHIASLLAKTQKDDSHLKCEGFPDNFQTITSFHAWTSISEFLR